MHKLASSQNYPAPLFASWQNVIRELQNNKEPLPPSPFLLPPPPHCFVWRETNHCKHQQLWLFAWAHACITVSAEECVPHWWMPSVCVCVCVCVWGMPYMHWKSVWAKCVTPISTILASEGWLYPQPTEFLFGQNQVKCHFFWRIWRIIIQLIRKDLVPSSVGETILVLTRSRVMVCDYGFIMHADRRTVCVCVRMCADGTTISTVRATLSASLMVIKWEEKFAHDFHMVWHFKGGISLGENNFQIISPGKCTISKTVRTPCRSYVTSDIFFSGHVVPNKFPAWSNLPCPIEACDDETV